MRRRLLALVIVTLVGVGLPAASTITAEADSPHPVIIVGGILEQNFQLQQLADGIGADGHQTFIYTLPGLGLGDIGNIGAAFSSFANGVLSTTHASQVDIVAHSEGGLVARYWMKNLGGASKVGTYVSLATPQYGTVVADLVAALGLGSCFGITACNEMKVGSAFVNNLNAGTDTPGSARYITVASYGDEAVQPVSNAALRGRATNVIVQNRCWFHVVGHLGMLTDGTVLSIVESALRGGAIQANCWGLSGGPL